MFVLAVAITLFVTLGSGSLATTLSVAKAASGDYDGKKAQVSGVVVADSYVNQGTVSTFTITDEDGSATLTVTYTGVMPTTFGNGVTAICTGFLQDGNMQCSEMITKCPSKYETAEGSITVSQLTNNGDVYDGLEVKLAGYIQAGSLADVNADARFVVFSQGASIPVTFDGALSDGIKDDVAVIVTGKYVYELKIFEAVDVAIDMSIEQA